MDLPVWESILRSRDILKKGIICKVAKGNRMSFQFDNWTENRNLIKITRIDEEKVFEPEAKICDFITQQSLQDILLPKVVFNNRPIIQKIQGFLIPIHELEDSFCWGLNSSSNFSTKSTTWAVHGVQLHETSNWPFNWIWKVDTTPKIEIFLW